MDTSEVPQDTAPPHQGHRVIRAVGLGKNGEHGPLFSDIDLELGTGFQVVQMPAGPQQSALLLTLAGRMRPSQGSLDVLGATTARTIRHQCAVAAFERVDELDESVTVSTVLAEQRRCIAPWYSIVPVTAGRTEMDQVFGDLERPDPHEKIGSLTELQQFLLRVTLALLSNRPVLVVSDLEQIRSDPERERAVERLHAIATLYTVVLGVTNPLSDLAPGHTLHAPRSLDRKD